MMNKQLTPCFFFCVSARLLPEKLTVYTTLVGLLNARNYNFGGEFVEAMIRQLKECLKVNMYNEAVHLVSGFLFVCLFYIFAHPFSLLLSPFCCRRAGPFSVYYSLFQHQHAVHSRYTKRCVLCEKYFLPQGRKIILQLQNWLATVYCPSDKLICTKQRCPPCPVLQSNVSDKWKSCTFIVFRGVWSSCGSHGKKKKNWKEN